MAKRYVISRKQIPTSVPVNIALIWLLLTREFHMPQWSVGIGWFVIGLLVVTAIVAIATEDQREVDL